MIPSTRETDPKADQPTVRVEFDWAPAEHGRFLRAALPLRPHLKWIFGATRALPPAVLIVAGTVGALGLAPLHRVAEVAWPWFALTAFWWVLATQLWRVVPWLLQREPPWRREERALSPQGLEVAGPRDVAFLTWTRMSRVLETRDLFLFVGPGDVYHIPKRTLSPDQLACVRELVRRCWSAPLKPALHPPAERPGI